MNRLEVLSSAIQGSVFKKTFTKILLERKGSIAIIWLNSLKDLNSLSPQMTHEIKQAILGLDHDSQVKIIIIRSKHLKVFCAGADIKHMKENDYAKYPYSLHFISVIKVFRSIRKPIISVVEGKALGGGFELALLTNIIIANKNASFALPEITLGLIPGMGGTQILPRITNTKVATKMILTGQPISAKEAHRLNIAYLIQQEGFQQKLSNILDNIAAKGDNALESAKRAVEVSQQTTLEQGLQHQATILQRLFLKKETNQSIRAHHQKLKKEK